MPLGTDDPDTLLRFLMQADEYGVKLELAGGTPTWEFFPSPLHQGVVQDLLGSVVAGPRAGELGCGCHAFLDTYVRLRDGSLKRPDLAIYCDPVPRTREAIAQTPGAVVEVISPGFEAKDLQTGPALYLANGVRDVVVIDPESERVHHFGPHGLAHPALGTRLRLAMGCSVAV